jgi:hypothetical protein
MGNYCCSTCKTSAIKDHDLDFETTPVSFIINESMDVKDSTNTE